MLNKNTVTLLMAITLGLASLVAAESAPASKPAVKTPAAAKKQAYDKIIGRIDSVDAAANKLEVTNAAGKKEAFALTQTTPISGHGKKLTLSQLKVGDEVSVRYTGGSMTVQHVFLMKDKKA